MEAEVWHIVCAQQNIHWRLMPYLLSLKKDSNLIRDEHGYSSNHIMMYIMFLLIGQFPKNNHSCKFKDEVQNIDF